MSGVAVVFGVEAEVWEKALVAVARGIHISPIRP